jgi:hypothetical protein
MAKRRSAGLVVGDFAERTPFNRAIGLETVHAALGKLRRE